MSPHLGRAQLSTTVVAASPSAARGGVLYARKRRRQELRCGLTRLSGDAGHRVLPSLATSDQWAHYWGDTDIQRVGKFFEVSAIAFLGLWACYFTSFFLGVGTMSILGGSFLFYWLLAPNVAAFTRNRALRGRIAPFPGGDGNCMAIFSARVASATEEYHPVTGEPVFMRMVVEDADGRALKFRTRTRAEYARVRPGMVAELVLVSPDEVFEEIVGVSDTFVPAANVWVGEYPYLDKVVMRRLLVNRDARGRQRGDEENDFDDEEELGTMTYRDAWTQTRGADPWREDSPPPLADSAGGSSRGDSVPDYYSDYSEDEDEIRYEGWGSSGFSSADLGGEDWESTGRRQQWERVSGEPRPRRERPAASRFEREDDSYTGRRTRESRNEREGDALWGSGDERDSRMAARREGRTI